MGTEATRLVAEEVRAALGRKMLTASALAEAVNMTTSTMSQRLRGQSPFTVDELARIADALDVPIRSFFPRLDQAVA